MSALSNGYAISERIAAKLRQICGGLPGDDGLWDRPHNFYHRLTWGATASTAAGLTSYTFFTVSGNDFETNMPQAGALPANYAFVLDHIAVDIETGIDVDGNQLATGVQASAAALTPLTSAEEIREALISGRAKFYIGDKLVRDVQDLRNLPSGKGLAVSSAVAASAGTGAAAVTSNGAPFLANRNLFPGGYPIVGGQQLRLEVSFPKSMTLTGGGIICAEMRGRLISPASA